MVWRAIWRSGFGFLVLAVIHQPELHLGLRAQGEHDKGEGCRRQRHLRLFRPRFAILDVAHRLLFYRRFAELRPAFVHEQPEHVRPRIMSRPRPDRTCPRRSRPGRPPRAGRTRRRSTAPPAPCPSDSRSRCRRGSTPIPARLPDAVYWHAESTKQRPSSAMCRIVPGQLSRSSTVGRAVELDALLVHRRAQQRHVILPADHRADLAESRSRWQAGSSRRRSPR